MTFELAGVLEFLCISAYAQSFAGPLLGRVPRVPGTRKILSSYVVAPVIFYEIPREQLPGTRKISTPLISGTRGLIFLTRAL